MHIRYVVLALSVASAALGAQTSDTIRVDYPAATCPSCAEWNAPQQPFRIFGNTYYVGTHGLASILVTSPQGHVLIDGALPASAPQIVANVRALGFRIEDVRLTELPHCPSGLRARSDDARTAALRHSPHAASGRLLVLRARREHQTRRSGSLQGVRNERAGRRGSAHGARARFTIAPRAPGPHQGRRTPFAAAGTCSH